MRIAVKNLCKHLRADDDRLILRLRQVDERAATQSFECLGGNVELSIMSERIASVASKFFAVETKLIDPSSPPTPADAVPSSCSASES
jgi:hypothetical protein